MEAQLYSLRASATRLTGKHWAAPYASSLLPRSRARARCGVGAFCPGSRRPRARVPLVVWAWDFLLCGFLAAVSRPLLAHCFSVCDLRLFVINGCFPRVPLSLPAFQAHLFPFSFCPLVVIERIFPPRAPRGGGCSQEGRGRKQREEQRGAAPARRLLRVHPVEHRAQRRARVARYGRRKDLAGADAQDTGKKIRNRRRPECCGVG